MARLLEPVQAFPRSGRHRPEQCVSRRTRRQDRRERGRNKLHELEPIIEDGLAGGAFLAGARPTIADLSLASSIFQLGFASIAPTGTETRSWFERMLAIEGLTLLARKVSDC